MKTKSVSVMNLCVPCRCHCRCCLLSYDGRITGVDYNRSEKYAKSFHSWLCENRPELSFTFGYGYSMEHPQLLDAIDFCRSIGSINGEFLQFNGMKFRNEAELNRLLTDIRQHGVKLIDLTFYGTEKYHDIFAGRKGDFKLLLSTLAQANKIGLDVSVSIALSHENSAQLNDLITLLQNYITKKITCFVPHSEGAGASIG